MGSPSAVISLGIGSWASVNEVVTLGYGSSVVSVVTITDIGLEWTLLKAPNRIDIGAKMERIQLKATRRIEVKG